MYTDKLVQSVLQLFSFTKVKLEEFGKIVDNHTDSLVAILHDTFLVDSKLKPVLTSLKEKASNVCDLLACIFFVATADSFD